MDRITVYCDDSNHSGTRDLRTFSRVEGAWNLNLSAHDDMLVGDVPVEASGMTPGEVRRSRREIDLRTRRVVGCPCGQKYVGRAENLSDILDKCVSLGVSRVSIRGLNRIASKMK